MSDGTRSDEPLVEILRTADASLLPVVKSLLEAAGIDFFVQGEEAFGLYPLGAFGGGGEKRFMAAVVEVPIEQADEARQLLQEVEVIEEPGEEAAE